MNMQELLGLSMPQSKSYSVSHLWKLQNMLLSHVQSLETFGVTGAQYGVVLTPLPLSKLSPDLRLEWARDGAGHESDLDFLLEFLHNKIQRRERSQAFSGFSHQAAVDARKKKR